jgi:hypothetical protein
MRNVAKRPILVLTAIALAGISRGTAVGFAGTTASAGAAMLGVADTAAYVNDELAVDVIGTTSCVAGAAIAVGALIQVGADGKFITKAAGVTVGRALTAAAGDGADFSALLIPSDA